MTEEMLEIAPVEDTAESGAHDTEEAHGTDTEQADTSDNRSEEIDYSAIVREDIETLKREFLELEGLGSIAELDNPLRYAQLRDLGLSAEEAYLATSRKRRKQDNRAHLFSSMPKGAGTSGGSMSRAELEMARELFPDISDAQIQRLYKSVTK